MNASTASLTPSQTLNRATGASSTAASSTAAAGTTAASSTAADTSPDISRASSSRANASTTSGATNVAPAAADRNFSATEDQYGPLPQGWERRTDHLGRTYYVSEYSSKVQ